MHGGVDRDRNNLGECKKRRFVAVNHGVALLYNGLK
jgi:hypothetical protein